MRQNSTTAGQPIAPEKNNRLDLERREPITSFHGQRLFECKDCCSFVQVAFHVTGKMESPYDGSIIFIDYLEDAKGHCLKEMSH